MVRYLPNPSLIVCVCVTVQSHLVVPPEKAITEMSVMFERMTKTACAISKLEFLLEVVRLTYENIKDSKQPKKPMNNLGADGKGSSCDKGWSNCKGWSYGTGWSHGKGLSYGT